jgi:hypothetical protein
VTSVTPNTGTTAGGTPVVITGANFTGVTAVSFGGTAATSFTFVNATTINATTPAHAAGAVSVVVTTPAGSNGANTAFTYALPVPAVTSVTPSNGPAAGGTVVTIAGINFTGATAVKFGATNAATYTVNSATQVTATSPAGTGTVDITVTTAGGTSATSAADQFTFGAAADSQKLRAMQTAVTPVVAQISGQAITGAIDNAMDGGFSDSPPAVTPNGGGFTFNFGAEPQAQQSPEATNNVRDFIDAPDRRVSRIDDAFSALAYGKITKAPPRLTAPPREWQAWLDVRGMSTDRNTAGSDLKGDQINATAGITRKLTPDFLIGAFGGFEHFDYSSNAFNARLKGDGWTAGAYVGWRPIETLRFDLAVARTALTVNGTAGAATASFPGSRWLVSGGMTGTYKWQALVFQPSARVYALWEHEDGYTDSLGAVQTDRNFSSGRASGGAKFAYPVVWNAITFAPNLGLYGDYYFTGDNAAAAPGVASTPLLQGWSARFTAGLDLKFINGGSLSFGGELGGIGGNTTMWTYRGRGTVPF